MLKGKLFLAVAVCLFLTLTAKTESKLFVRPEITASFQQSMKTFFVVENRVRFPCKSAARIWIRRIESSLRAKPTKISEAAETL